MPKNQLGNNWSQMDLDYDSSPDEGNLKKVFLEGFSRKNWRDSQISNLLKGNWNVPSFSSISGSLEGAQLRQFPIGTEASQNPLRNIGKDTSLDQVS